MTVKATLPNGTVTALVDSNTMPDWNTPNGSGHNRKVILSLAHEAGLTHVDLEWAFLLADNDWFWTIDNIMVYASTQTAACMCAVGSIVQPCGNVSAPAQTLTSDPCLEDSNSGAVKSCFNGGSCASTHVKPGLLGQVYQNTIHQEGPVSGNYTTVGPVQFHFGPACGATIGGVAVCNLWSLALRGNLTVPSTDTYTLYLSCDDGCRLYIDGVIVFDLVTHYHR